MRIDVHPAASRFVTTTDWLVSRHSFSFGQHYDAANVDFGVLVAHNDDVLQPGGGFSDHPHRGVDIVTWVTRGALTHSDDVGGSGVVSPGVVQVLSAGRGVRLSEVNASDGVTRYVQMWVSSDDDSAPAYSIAEAPCGADDFALIASGSGGAPLRLRQPAARLFAASLTAGAEVALPLGIYAHLFVADGAALLGDVPLLAGDAARITRTTGPGALSITATTDAQLLLWVMDAARWRPPVSEPG
jgi:redox-sensitive bicupin YhaK (pirin superfamily)